jgi:hypothetical protein
MPMLDWWKSWHGAPTDDKWLVIAKRAGVTAIMVPAIAWALLDHASQAENRGDVSTFDVEAYALKFGLDEDQVRAVISAMEARTMIVGGRISQWDKRQRNEATERSRKHRGKGSTPELPLDVPAPEKAPTAESASPPESSVEPPAPNISPTDAENGLITPQAIALADEIATAVGYELDSVPMQWCGAASRVQVWLNQNWPAPFILPCVKAQMARKRDGPPVTINYFEPGLAKAMARAEAPVPNVVPITDAKQVRHGRQPSTITAVADRLIADLEPGSGQARESSSRLLSDGRCE